VNRENIVFQDQAQPFLKFRIGQGAWNNMKTQPTLILSGKGAGETCRETHQVSEGWDYSTLSVPPSAPPQESGTERWELF